ncbi:MAG TPA: hypothetical protein LFV91_05475 [Rickettsia endosymbiont of Bembidion nr. Transversale]|nr:hypothetical protein [Rickettsia endosymbiont of Bembidion nr. Transversale]
MSWVFYSFYVIPEEALPAWIVSPCHPVIYELEPVKNTNKISIFYYFLDLVPKPRYDIVTPEIA